MALESYPGDNKDRYRKVGPFNIESMNLGQRREWRAWLALNALIGLLGISIINVIICTFAYILETGFLLPLTEEQVIRYEKIENIKPESRTELINDLKERTGLEIKHLHVESVDFLNDTAQIRIFYKG